MDACERMFQEEADTLAFLLQEEFMEEYMKHERWMRLQRESEALQAWARQPIPIPIMYRAHDPILHTEENGYWCDNPSCPCRQDRSYCERYVKVEIS